MSRQVFSAQTCATSVQTFVDLAFKRTSRKFSRDQLELMEQHANQALALLRDPGKQLSLADLMREAAS
jgi:DNA-binding response OmpR family regulator